LGSCESYEDAVKLCHDGFRKHFELLRLLDNGGCNSFEKLDCVGDILIGLDEVDARGRINMLFELHAHHFRTFALWKVKSFDLRSILSTNNKAQMRERMQNVFKPAHLLCTDGPSTKPEPVRLIFVTNAKEGPLKARHVTTSGATGETPAAKIGRLDLNYGDAFLDTADQLQKFDKAFSKRRVNSLFSKNVEDAIGISPYFKVIGLASEPLYCLYHRNKERSKVEILTREIMISRLGGSDVIPTVLDQYNLFQRRIYICSDTPHDAGVPFPDAEASSSSSVLQEEAPGKKSRIE